MDFPNIKKCSFEFGRNSQNLEFLPPTSGCPKTNKSPYGPSAPDSTNEPNSTGTPDCPTPLYLKLSYFLFLNLLKIRFLINFKYFLNLAFTMNLLTLKDWNSKDIISVLHLAQDIKKMPNKYANSLASKSLAMLFQKNSTRTRISFEAGMTQLGGHAQYLDWRTTNVKGDNLYEEIKCIERYVDVIMARVYDHKDIQTMADASSIPIINGLCDLYHPCQILADLLTIKEKFGKLDGLKLAYVGDGNNICHSLLIGCAKTGVHISVATPEGYEPLAEIVDYAKKISPNILVTNDPKKAVKNADVVYTDTWISMGQEEEKKKRLKDFKGWIVDSKLMELSNNAYFMHCLPAYKGYEVSEKVLTSKKSIVFDQAENRMHAQKAILLKCLGIS